MDKYEMYSEILKDINTRTNGEYERLSLSDKVMIKNILGCLRDDIVDYLSQNWQTIEDWYNLDIEKEIERCKEPDFDKLRKIINAGWLQ